MAHFQHTVSRFCARHASPHSGAHRKLYTALLLTLSLCMGGSQAARAQDGHTILTKALQMYQGLHSYVGWANVDTMMVGPDGKTIKSVSASSVMKLQQPDNIYLFLQNVNGSRSIYSDGTNFSVYDATPDQYFTIPMVGKEKNMLHLLTAEGEVGDALDPLYFLTRKSLPKELTNVQFKGASSFNGHPVYVVSGVTNATPIVKKNGATTIIIPTTYWTWWIDQSNSFLYKIEAKTPNVTKSVSFGSGKKRVVRDVKGTLFVRHIVSEIKPDTNLLPSVFAFKAPATATRMMTTQEARNTHFR